MGGVRRDKARWRIVPTGLALTLLLATGPAFAQDRADDLEIPAEAEPARYIENVDGDSIVVELDGKEVEVELIGVDAPETAPPGGEPDCYGNEAKSKTDSLLVTAEDDTVWLERDIRNDDDEGRLLRYVWYVSIIDGEVHFLNEELIRQGYALPDVEEPNDAYEDELIDARDDAIRAGAGLWLTCDASVSMDPTLEADGRPDDVPIDRTKTPVADDPEAACALFGFFQEAQDWLDEFPELADQLDADGDGIACETFFEMS